MDGLEKTFKIIISLIKNIFFIINREFFGKNTIIFHLRR